MWPGDTQPASLTAGFLVKDLHARLDTICAGSLLGATLARLVEDCPQLLCKSLQYTFDLQGLRLDSKLSEATTIKSMLLGLIMPEQWQVEAAHVLRALDKGLPVLSAEGNKISLLQDMLALFGTVSVELPSCKLLPGSTEGSTESGLVEVCHLSCMLSVLAASTRVASFLAFLHKYFLQNEAPLVRDNKVAPEITKALQNMRHWLANMGEAVQSVTYQWAVPIASFGAWVDSAGRVLDALAHSSLQAVADVLEASVVRVGDAGRDFSPYVTEREYKRAMVHKFLYKWKGKEAHSAAHIDCVRVGNSFKAAHADLGVATPLESLHGAVLDFFDKEYAKGKTLLKVVACVDVIEGCPGEAQLQDAQSLLEKYDKDTDIPLRLKTELKTILETKPRKKRKKADATGETG